MRSTWPPMTCARAFTARSRSVVRCRSTLLGQRAQVEGARGRGARVCTPEGADGAGCAHGRSGPRAGEGRALQPGVQHEAAGLVEGSSRGGVSLTPALSHSLPLPSPLPLRRTRLPSTPKPPARCSQHGFWRSPVYRDKDGNPHPLTQSKQPKYWELAKCLSHSLSPLGSAENANLLNLLDIRHEIEHRC